MRAPLPSRVALLCGLPGSGTSTLARRLVRELSLPLMTGAIVGGSPGRATRATEQVRLALTPSADRWGFRPIVALSSLVPVEDQDDSERVAK